MEKREQARSSSLQRVRMRRQRKQNKAGMLGITLIVLMLVGVMSVQIISLYRKDQEYKKREADLTAQLESEQQRQEEIQEYKEYVTTKEYIEQIAKTKLGLVYSNEIIFKESSDKGQ